LSKRAEIAATFDLWWRATRAPFLSASITPVLAGTAVAYHQAGEIDGLILLLALCGAICAHLGANLFNDYGDHLSGSDEINQDYTPFSGGSRLIQTGIIQPHKIRRAAILCFVITIIIGVLLINLIQNWTLLLFGSLGLLIGLIYSLAPLKLAYRGLGEIVVSFAFGPLIVTGSYFVQTQRINWQILLISVPVGLLVGLILFINEVQDEEADRRSGKATLVVWINNPYRSMQLFRYTLLICYLFTAILIMLNIVPITALILFLTLPLLRRLWHISKQSFTHPNEILPANGMTIQLQMLFTVLLAASFFLSKPLIR